MIKYLYFDFFDTLAFLSKDVDWDEVFNIVSGHFEKKDKYIIQSIWIKTFLDLQQEAEKTHIEFSMDDVSEKHSILFPQYPKKNFYLLTKTYMQLWAQAIIMYKDALENIPKLAKKYELGIISNTHDSDLVPSILSRYDLKKYFQQVVLSVNEKFRKPSIKIFQAATGEQYYANEWCFVGDNFEQDIQGAKAANIYPILILRKSSTISTDNCTIIHTLDEIHNVLKTGG